MQISQFETAAVKQCFQKDTIETSHQPTFVLAQVHKWRLRNQIKPNVCV